MDLKDIEPSKNDDLTEAELEVIRALGRLIQECINEFGGFVRYHLNVSGCGEYVVTAQSCSPLRIPIERKDDDPVREWLQSN